MNKNVTKGLVVGALIAGYFVYRYFKQKNDALEQSYNEQLSLLENAGSETAKKNEEFVEIDDECVLIGDAKALFNMFIGYDSFDEVDVYTPQTRDDFKKVFANTNHFYNETDGLRKMFLFDIVKTGGNMTGTDYPPRPLKYEYSAGLISLGDKGSDVKKLQELINQLYAFNSEMVDTQLMVNSTYDKETQKAVTELFKDTSALVDTSKGAIAKEFVNNFATILENI